MCHATNTALKTIVLKVNPHITHLTVRMKLYPLVVLHPVLQQLFQILWMTSFSYQLKVLTFV